MIATLFSAASDTEGTLTRGTATLGRRGEVAQSVEHTAENRGVAGSIPALATFWHSQLGSRRIAYISGLDFLLPVLQTDSDWI